MQSTGPDCTGRVDSQVTTLAIAVGIIYRNGTGEVLVSQRPAQLEQAGFWEFPGGKIETGENPAQALCRELKEEINIIVHSSRYFLEYEYDYGNRRVRLYVRKVEDWNGTVNPNEGQNLRWMKPAGLAALNMLAGNYRIIDALTGKSPP